MIELRVSTNTYRTTLALKLSQVVHNSKTDRESNKQYDISHDNDDLYVYYLLDVSGIVTRKSFWLPSQSRSDKLTVRGFQRKVVEAQPRTYHKLNLKEY